MADISFELAVIVLLAIVNGVFAMSEVALLSARKPRLSHLAERGNANARRALDLLHDPNNFLSTVQIGVTLVGVWAGAFGGATMAEQIAASLDRYPRLQPYSEPIGIGLVVVLITYVSLVVGELVPKRIAMANPERIAARMAAPMSWISRIASPVVGLLSVSTNALLWVMRVRKSTEPSVTEEDIRALVRMGTESGALKLGEQQIVERVFRFADRKVTAFMTHRAAIQWLDINDPAETIAREVRNARYSRLPVGDGSLDRVLGILIVRDFLLAAGTPDLRGLLKHPVYVPERLPALAVLESLRNTSVRIALVVDEYGGIEGLVSATDVLEALVGELPGEQPATHPVVERADGSWLIDGTLPVEDLRELLHLEALPGEGEQAFETAAGFFIYHVGRIPRPADTFDFQGFRLEVVDMDGNKIDKLLLTLRRDSTL